MALSTALLLVCWVPVWQLELILNPREFGALDLGLYVGVALLGLWVVSRGMNKFSGMLIAFKRFLFSYLYFMFISAVPLYFTIILRKSGIWGDFICWSGFGLLYAAILFAFLRSLLKIKRVVDFFPGGFWVKYGFSLLPGVLAPFVIFILGHQGSILDKWGLYVIGLLITALPPCLLFNISLKKDENVSLGRTVLYSLTALFSLFGILGGFVLLLTSKVFHLHSSIFAYSSGDSFAWNKFLLMYCAFLPFLAAFFAWRDSIEGKVKVMSSLSKFLLGCVFGIWCYWFTVFKVFGFVGSIYIGTKFGRPDYSIFSMTIDKLGSVNFLFLAFFVISLFHLIWREKDKRKLGAISSGLGLVLLIMIYAGQHFFYWLGLSGRFGSASSPEFFFPLILSFFRIIDPVLFAGFLLFILGGLGALFFKESNGSQRSYRRRMGEILLPVSGIILYFLLYPTVWPLGSPGVQASIDMAVMTPDKMRLISNFPVNFLENLLVNGRASVPTFCRNLESRNPYKRNLASLYFQLNKDQRAKYPLMKAFKKDPGDGGVALALANFKDWDLSLMFRSALVNGKIKKYDIEALGKHGDPMAILPLLKRLADKDSEDREYVAKALGYFKSVRVVEALIAQLEHEGSMVVRSEISGALAKILTGGYFSAYQYRENEFQKWTEFWRKNKDAYCSKLLF